MAERAEVELRYKAWEHMKKLLVDKAGIALKLGENGENLVDKLLNMVIGIHKILGLAEYELDVPGGVFNTKFEDNVRNGLNELKYFLDKGLGREDVKEIANGVLVQLSPSSSWMKSGEPLVIAEEMSGKFKDDKETVVKILMDCDDIHRFVVVPIIGLPGTGKTTVAQNVYHDQRVYRHFEVRHWVSMSETHETRSKLLDQIFRRQTVDNEVIREFHALVDDKKYLLILDGITQSVPVRIWDDLLCNVANGSKVVFTCTSSIIDQSVTPRLAKGTPYELGYLSEIEAMSLFGNLAFRDGEKTRNQILYNFGSKLFREKHARVPLIIKNIATFLSTKDTLQDSGYGVLESTLLNINLCSYKDLAFSKQQCIKYCALFPVDYEFRREYLIHLWSAQAFIEGPLEVVGYEYFRELQKNGYIYEKNKSDSNGPRTIVSYTMHELMCQFLKDVSKEFCLMDNPAENIEHGTIVHLSFSVDSSWSSPSWLVSTKQLLSLLFLPRRCCDFAIIPNIDRILSSLKNLRALDLLGVNCENLSDSIEELRDLEYLRLGCSAEYLPECISKLKNLQTLDLRHSKVRVLPKDFCELIKLRNLYTGDRLDDLPPNMKELTSLRTLDVFIVGENNGIGTLSHLYHLSGKLKIRYKKCPEKHASGNAVGLVKSIHLTDLSLIWSTSYKESSPDGSEFMLPPPTLEILKICHWKAITFPQWKPSNLDKLVLLHIKDCNKCSDLPVFSKLPHLKYLELIHLDALEYIEKGDENSTASSAEAPYFPSLEYLTLANLPNLKQWSLYKKPCFPRLTVLKITACLKVISIPLVPMLESLQVDNINEKFLKHLLSAQESPAGNPTLKELRIATIPDMVSLAMNLSSLKTFQIWHCPQLQTLIVEASSSLMQFEIHESGKLLEIIGALKHLTVNWKLGVVKSWNDKL